MKVVQVMVGVTLLASLGSCTDQSANPVPSPESAVLRMRPGETYAATVAGIKIFVADRDGHPLAFVNSAQHLPGELVWWCPNEKVFAAPTHGELFDADGHYLAGPASRDMDQMMVAETNDPGGRLFFDVRQIQQGKARSEADSFVGASPELKSQYLQWTNRRQGEPGAFCLNRVPG